MTDRYKGWVSEQDVEAARHRMWMEQQSREWLERQGELMGGEVSKRLIEIDTSPQEGRLDGHVDVQYISGELADGETADDGSPTIGGEVVGPHLLSL